VIIDLTNTAASGPGGVISNATDMVRNDQSSGLCKISLLIFVQAIWLQTLLLDGVKPGTNASVIPASAIEKVATGISVSSGQA
jgi:hypothetical protein